MADQQLVVEVISPDAPKTGAAQGRWASAPFVAGAVLVALGVGALATALHRARAQQLRLTSHPLVRGGMAAAAALAIGAPVYAAADAPAPMVSEFARLPSVQLEDAPTVSVNKAELKARLTPLQFQVAVEGGTEPAFKNEYWNEHRKGTYVSVVSGRPLFRSEDKYDSGTGWPSFTRPVSDDAVVYRKDYSYGMTRVEVLERGTEAHLGHVFPDGPRDSTGLRFCMNSASLRFVPDSDQ